MDRQHNPNYPPRHSPPSSLTPFSQPPSSQIAPQQPAFDPFQRSDQRRDPFMPVSLSNRRESHGGNGRLSDVLQPPLQRPSSPFRPSPQSSFANERRNSLESKYSAESGQPSQSSQHQGSSLLSRHMPPPSTSPKESPSQSYSNPTMRAPPHLPASRPRDPPQRSSSMSIQSIMGADSGPTASQPAWSSAATSSSTPTYTHPPSPLDHRYNARRDPDAEPAPHTPIRRPDGPGYAPYDRPVATSLPSPSSNSAAVHQSSERDSKGLSRLLQPLHYASDVNANAPSRPYSQPSVDGPDGTRSGSIPHDGRPMRGARDSYVGGTFEKAVRDRSFSDRDRTIDTSTEHVPRPTVEPFSPVSGPPQPIHATYQPRHTDYRDPLLNGNGTRENSRGPGSPAHFSNPASAPGQYATVNGTAEPLSAGNGGIRQPDTQIYSYPRPFDTPQTRSPPSEAQLRRSFEDASRQSFARFANELGRRPDRSSPLPQAVQGAQGQPAGSARDPGVKSEFGRMFSGVGNGLRNTPQPLITQSNGAGTPRRSPDEGLAEMDRPARRGGTTAGGTRATGPGSRGGRRGKRQLVEDVRPDSDEGDGRLTPTGANRGAKRGRYLQHSASHHHHHHPTGPHHHHHHGRKPDDGSVFPLSRRASGTPYNATKFPPPASGVGPSDNTLLPYQHHHHHHPHPNGVPHHHHHLHKSIPEARVTRPVVNISTSPLLRSVANLPCRHLGSQIYEPTLEMAPAASSTIDSPLSHQGLSKPNPLPRFDKSQCNSTFTVRVPRYYLSDTERERICKSRQLWGTDVYTDDSDPLAAAFHSGWIRGSWPAGVDAALLLELWASEPSGSKAKDATGSKSDESSPATLTEPPPNGPPPPPPNRDVHLTLRILPTLEKYAGFARYGVKSRKWGGNHDGLSFKIEKVEWVDEGLGSRYEERGAAAKKRRMADWIASSKLGEISRQNGQSGEALQDAKGHSQALKSGVRKRAAAIPAA